MTPNIDDTVHITRVLEKVDRVEAALADLETELVNLEARGREVPPEVAGQLEALDATLFALKQRLNTAWGVTDFTAPLSTLRDHSHPTEQ